MFEVTVFGHIVLLAALFLLKDDATWVLNLPGAPMLLEGRFPRAYSLKNTSGKQVSSFTLGCVAMKKHKIAILSILPRQKFSIDPGGSFGEAVIDAPYLDQYEQCVVRQKVKLGLISVSFEDQTSWNFNEGGTEGEATH